MEEEEEDICDVCSGGHETEACPELGLDATTKNATQLSRARLTLPHNLDITGEVTDGTLQVVATYDISAKTQFGPFEAKRSTKDVPLDGVFALKVLSKDESSVVLDTSDENECNWLCLVAAAQTSQDQNCIAYQLGVNIFYNTTRIIRNGETLNVWYAHNYAKKLGKPVKPDGITKVMLGTDIGKLLSTPAPAIQEEQPLGKRRRKMTAHFQEFLESARKKVKTETPDVPYQTPRKRGRPRKIKPVDLIQTTQDLETRVQGSTGQGEGKELDEMRIDGDLIASDDTQEEGGNYQCTRCTKSFQSQNSMVLHLRTHIRNEKEPSEPVRTMFCTECGKGFVNSSNLARHSKLHEQSTVMLSCSICEYETYRQDIMRTHMEARHSIKSPAPRPRGRPRKTPAKVIIKKTGRPRGRPRKIPRQNYSDHEELRNDPDVYVPDLPGTTSPKRVLPQRSNRGKKMMEILSPRKKKSYKEVDTEESDDDDDDEDEDDDDDVDDDDDYEEEIAEREGSVKKDQEENPEIAEPVELIDDTGHVGMNPEKAGVELELGEVALEEGTILTEVEVIQQPDGIEDISDVLMSLASGGFVQTIEAPMTDEPMTQEPSNSGDAPVELPVTEIGDVAITDIVAVSELPAAQITEAVAELEEVPSTELTNVPVAHLGPEVQSIELTNVPVAHLGPEVQSIELTNVPVAHLGPEVQSTELTNEEMADLGPVPTIESSETNQESAGEISEGDKAVEQTITEAATESGNVDVQSTQTPLVRKRGRPRKSSIVLNPPQTKAKDQFVIYVTQDDRTIYGCKHCDKKFENERFVKKHAVVHTKNFECEKCGKTFALQDTYERHTCEDEKPAVVMTITGDEVRYSCTECGKSFVQEDYARQHATIHKDLLECRNCTARFHSKAGLNHHTCKSAAKNTFACDICSQSFRTSGYLFRHMAMHTDIFKCNICGKCFSRKDSMLRHVVRCDPVRALSEDIHACVNCHKAYTSLDALETHMQSCCRDFCSKCKTNFTQEDDFNKHECVADVSAISPAKFDPLSYRFTCQLCSKEFRNIRYLRRHEATHNGQYKCKICCKSFSRKEEFVWHIVICENSEKIKTEGFVTCDQCSDGVQYIDMKSFRHHHFTHTHPYKCEKCMKRFRKQGSVVTHHCDPYQYQDGGFPCPHCDKIFSCRMYMERHAVIHGERQFECEICKKRFFREDYIKDHRCLLPDGSQARIVRRNNQVLVKENVVCHLCGASFVSDSNLTKHLKTHGDKNYECDICLKKFHYLAYMKDHKVHVHGNGLDLQCASCGRIFKTKTSLRSHIAQFHSGVQPQHECQICHKTFRQRGNLKTHMYSHSTSKQFQCPMCPKTFKYPDQLARHKLEHTMKNKIMCELCPKQFVKEFEYKRHMSTFHSGMAYVCSLCNEKCSHRHTLIRHFKRKHRGALHLLSDGYIQDLLVPIKKDDNGQIIVTETGTEAVVDHMEEVATIDSTDVVAEAIANAALANEVTNTPTMSIGQTFTNELGETFTESVITDAEGNETRIVYRTPEGFSDETDLPQVAAEALQSLSNTIITGDETTTVDFSNLEGAELHGDEQHTVVIVQIVNQDGEETELGETYTIQTEDLNV